MATDELSSLSVADNDIFSMIPDHIIHHILALLPSMKDVVRTSPISKSWLQAWLTFPIPQFNFSDFPYRSRNGKEAQLQFIRFVDNTLQRFGGQNGEGMKKFNLSTLNKMAHHHTNRWIGMALDIKVEHLALRISNDSLRPCLIPDRILCAYWLKSLKLVGSTICIQSLTEENSPVDLPLLTSLRIQGSDHLNDQQLQKLLNGCPALEEIALLECQLLSKVDIFYHPNLETLEFKVSKCTIADHVIAIMVRAPNLKSFSYDNCDTSWCKCDLVVDIHNSPELKSLTITKENKTDEWFDKFITQFPLLENLTIERCYKLRKIRISNPLLQKIKIRNCNRLKDVVISSKKMNCFCLFTRYSSIPNPTIRLEMDNPPIDCMANINHTHIWGDHPMEAIWYRKLKEFLSGPFTFKSLIINMNELYAEDGDMNAEDVHKKLPHTACNIEKLSVYAKAPSSCHPHILNGLLSTCHPTTIELDDISDNSFGKSVCEELGNRDNNSKCWCKDDFKCWKHQLKEVKVEKIKGIKLKDDLEWDALFNLLPNLKFGDIISFNLMW